MKSTSGRLPSLPSWPFGVQSLQLVALRDASGFSEWTKALQSGAGAVCAFGRGVVIVDGQAQPYETLSFPGPQFLLCYETVPQ